MRPKITVGSLSQTVSRVSVFVDLLYTVCARFFTQL